MSHFFMNGYVWHIVYVGAGSPVLIDRTNHRRVATTDPGTRCIYICNDLDYEFLKTVLLHELAHCVMLSYGILEEVHRFTTPDKWVEAEEWVCNFIADYGREVFYVASQILNDPSILSAPRTTHFTA